MTDKNKGKNEALILLSGLKHFHKPPTLVQKQKAYLALKAGLLDDNWLTKQAGLSNEEVRLIREVAEKYTPRTEDPPSV